MKTILLPVEEEDYRSLKSLAEHTGRSIEELIHEAISQYLEQRGGRSIFAVSLHDGGALLKPWTREELMDEMLDQ